MKNRRLLTSAWNAKHSSLSCTPRPIESRKRKRSRASSSYGTAHMRNGREGLSSLHKSDCEAKVRLACEKHIVYVAAFRKTSAAFSVFDSDSAVIEPSELIPTLSEPSVELDSLTIYLVSVLNSLPIDFSCLPFP